MVPGEYTNNSSRNALCTFNSFPCIWFPLFKLTLFNHTDAAIKWCSGKAAFLEFKTDIKNQANSFEKYLKRSLLLSYVSNF